MTSMTTRWTNQITINATIAMIVGFYFLAVKNLSSQVILNAGAIATGLILIGISYWQAKQQMQAEIKASGWKA